ncbi:hypothetical protein QA600_22115, partial [Natronococcus sp. A-GB1]|uniref:phage baseplate plug family protein n=1 Tax=Natronococcus sp. A-GB1 TaxID=3037648 RepID=UPI00241D40AE
MEFPGIDEDSASTTHVGEERRKVTGVKAGGALEAFVDELKKLSSEYSRPGPSIKDDFRLQELYTIPISSADKSKFTITNRDNAAWPNRAIDIQFDWNRNGECWVWSVEKHDGEKTIISNRPAHYGKPYLYDNYLAFMFIDFGEHEHKVTKSNLGNR